MARPSKILTKEDLLRAMSQTRSNRAAARYLHVSYNHYKKYLEKSRKQTKYLKENFSFDKMGEILSNHLNNSNVPQPQPLKLPKLNRKINSITANDTIKLPKLKKVT